MKLLIEVLQNIVTAKSVTDIHRLAKDIIKEFFPEVPFPQFKIVHHTSPKWYGRAEIKIHKETLKKTPTIIKIQKSIIQNEDALRAIVAHELIHHWDYENTDWAEELRKPKWARKDGHGKEFMGMAAKMNAVYGKDFVTEKSDLFDIETDQREYYLLIQPSKAKEGDLWTNMIARPSKAQKEKIARYIKDNEAHIVKINDKKLAKSSPLSTGWRGGRVTTWPEPEDQKRLKELYEGANLDKQFL